MSDNKEFKVGDVVFHVRYGWVTVEDNRDTKYPLSVDDGNIGVSLLPCGREYKGDKYPSIYTHDPINNTFPPEPEILWHLVPRDTDVIVWDGDDPDQVERKFVFKETANTDYPFRCFDEGDSSEDNCGKTEGWTCCKLKYQSDIEKYSKCVK